MFVTWLGTASLIIENHGRRILFDPYLKRLNPTLPPFPLDGIGDVEAIFITHPHFDHFSDMPAILEKTNCPVYACLRGLEIAEEQGFGLDRMRPIAPGEGVDAAGMTVRAWQGSHCRFDLPVVRATLRRTLRHGRVRPAAELEALNHRFRIDPEWDVLAFEVSAEGKRAFLLGSANCREDVEYPQNMELLIYPYQGRYDMARYAMPFLERFQPRRVMLDHFDDAFPPVSAQVDCRPFEKMARETYPGLDVILPKEGDRIEI